MIAMAIACEPKLLIADEPTTALDVTIQKQILELIASLQKRTKMSCSFITHDLAVVGEIADYVVVMRNGEIREQGPAKAVFETPKDTYTKALLLCRPQLDRRPTRLPVIDDFMHGTGPQHMEDRRRGVRPSDPIVLDVKNLGKSFYSREGLFGKREFKAVKNVSFQLPKGKTLGPRRRVGLRQDDGRADADAPARGYHRRGDLRGTRPAVDVAAGLHGVQAAHPDHLPESVRVAQSPLHRRPDHRRADVDPRHRQVGAGAHRHGVRAAEQGRAAEVSFYKYPHEFSGGQRQRIAIARCLTMKPDILICDESVSALDVSVQAQVLNLLQDLQDEYKLSYIFISHDLAVVKYISDQVMVMNDGEIVEIANSDEIYRHPKMPYTQRLLSSIPRGWRGERSAQPAD
jgi:peptide/nickel transport system ATP-binding protein